VRISHTPRRRPKRRPIAWPWIAMSAHHGEEYEGPALADTVGFRSAP